MSESDRRWRNTIRGSRFQGFSGTKRLVPEIYFVRKDFSPALLQGCGRGSSTSERVDAEVKYATGANAEAILRYRNSVLRAAEDVEDSFSHLAQSELRGDEILVEIAALQRVRDRSQEAYEAGAIALTDVLDADRQLLVARDELALTRETAARAAVASFRALGGGWTP